MCAPRHNAWAIAIVRFREVLNIDRLHREQLVDAYQIGVPKFRKLLEYDLTQCIDTVY